MKKIILAIALFIAVDASAQSDGFFTSTYQEARGDGMGNYPALIGHGLTEHQDANAPLGSGLLILGGLAFAYGIRKRKWKFKLTDKNNGVA